MTTVAEPQIINMRDYDNGCPSWAFRMDRRTPYGNPYSHLPSPRTSAKYFTATRDVSIVAHALWLKEIPEGQKVAVAFLKHYRGQPMACWCYPLSCHCQNFRTIWMERVDAQR